MFFLPNSSDGLEKSYVLKSSNPVNPVWVASIHSEVKPNLNHIIICTRIKNIVK